MGTQSGSSLSKCKGRHMVTFQYEALDETGHIKDGTIEAETPDDAKTKLNERGLRPLSITESAASDDLKSAANRKEWLVILIGAAVGGGIPLYNRELRQQMIDEGWVVAGVIGGAAIGAAAASLLYLHDKLNNRAARAAVLVFGILIVVLAVCFTLISMLD